MRSVDAVVVGAGFAGLYMLHRLRGLGFSARVYEAGNGVGGTWYWNRYPGARCDVESMDYSYSFSDELQQEWKWTERYAPQPEILKYINHVADRFDLRRDIQLETRVTAAVFDEATNRWTVETDRGDRVSARFCIMATGCLSSAQVPKFKGLETFEGTWYHTGHWPHEGVDFTGQTVAIIGTGSSAIQSIPIIAKQTKHLYVFQRTPNYSVPARNAPLDADYERSVKADYAEFRRQARESRVGFVMERSEESALAVEAEQRRREYEKRWDRGGLGFSSAYADILTDQDANATAAEFFRAKIHAIVRDASVADLLVPRDYPLGTKRLCVDTNYYDTFNRDNVTLLDLRKDPIEAITPHGLQTRDRAYTLDSIVFAIGFDAMTGALLGIDIRGRAGQTLKSMWAAGPRTYLGLSVAGFPNFFMITGPGQPVRAQQHDRVDRAARGLDRRLRDLYAHTRARAYRSEAGRAGCVGRPRQRGRQPHALSARQLLVHGRERPRQAAHLHAVHRRRRGLPPEVRRGRGEGLAGFYGLNVPAELGGGGIGLLGWSLAAEELAQGCASTALSFNMHLSVVGPVMESPLVPRATKERLAKMVVHEQKLIGGNFSEPTTSGLVGTAIPARACPARGRRLSHHGSEGLRVDDRRGRLLHGDGLSGRGDVSDRGDGAPGAARRDGTTHRQGVGHDGHARHAQRLHDARGVLGVRRGTGRAVGRHHPVPPSGRELVLGLLHGGLSRDRRRRVQGDHQDRPRQNAARVLTVPRVSPGRPPAGGGDERRSGSRAAPDLSLRLAQRYRGPDESHPVSALYRAKYFVGEAVTRITRTAMTLGGAHALLKTSPLERFFRDGAVAPVQFPPRDFCLASLGMQARPRSERCAAAVEDRPPGLGPDRPLNAEGEPSRCFQAALARLDGQPEDLERFHAEDRLHDVTDQERHDRLPSKNAEGHQPRPCLRQCPTIDTALTRSSTSDRRVPPCRGRASLFQGRRVL